MALTMKKKTPFITPLGIYYYKNMSFGLKNGGATNQKGIQLLLETQIGQNVVAYVDDVVMKSKGVGICLTASKRPSTIFVSTR
jgi:hypothetical protein